MNSVLFQLTPFDRPDLEGSIKLGGKTARIGRSISVEFVLHDPETRIEIPDPARCRERRSHLWESTCFEFFIRMKGAEPYWECNLSPAGHWNFFSFSGYRRGMAEEMALSALPFSVQRQSKGLKLAVTLPLHDIIPGECALDLALCAVLRAKNGIKSYWALTHTGPEPDFHRKETFLLTL